MLVSQYGYDVAFNYKTTPVKEGLAKHCPNGIDV
jgi:NADPH-dependent curcumin reductase CurA